MVSEYGRFDLRYVRTDKNGTKIYHDENCPRCCGYGELEQWAYTGRLCFACGGTGKRPKPKVVKIYTPEYADRLEQKRQAREAKRLLENPPPSKDELEAKVDETKRNNWEYEGFNRDGSGFFHTGETYPHREKFRQAGARWSTYMRGYISPVRLELKGIEIRKVTAQQLCNGYGWIDPEKAWDFLGR